MAVRPPRTPGRRGPAATEILDEAVALLRRTPLSLFFIYYLGAAPFCLGLIYFVFDMAQSTEAEAHLAPGALGLTLLYFWMKTCQAVFSRKVLELLEGPDPEPWGLSRLANTALLQTIFAGSFVLVYPCAILITIPFGWVHAFYHSISIVATGRRHTVRSSFGEAVKLSELWPKQNHLALGILFLALLFLFLNLAVFFSAMPELLSMLFGITTVFEENGSAWRNTSFYLDVFVFCYLILNPVNKALYVLRCFYGRARLTGADLKAELRLQQRTRREQGSLRGPVLAACLMLGLGLTYPAHGDVAAPTSPAGQTPGPVNPATAPAVPAAPASPATAALNRAIESTLRKDEFAWRLPRPVSTQEDDSLLARTLRRFQQFLHELGVKINHLIEKILDWLFGGRRNHDLSAKGASFLESIPWRLIFVLLVVAVVGWLSLLLLRFFRGRTATPTSKLQTVPVQTVDLEAEDVRADQLPEDSWLALAQDLIARGETRLALRALYLATLSVLARNELIRLGPAKSNRDYLLELTRRLRGDTEAVPFFRESVHLFEASWYGTHAVTSAILEQMQAVHHSVRTHATA